MAGYNWEKGKSNNAVAAEEQGLVVKSKITAKWLRDNGITETVRVVRLMIEVGAVVPTEWHHSSKCFNEVEYFSADQIKEDLALRDEAGHLAIFRKIAADQGARRLRGADLHFEFVRRLHETKAIEL